MTHDLQLRLDPRTAATDMLLTAEVSRIIDIDANRIKSIQTLKRSIDARQKKVMVMLTVRVWVDEQPPTRIFDAETSYSPIPDNAPTCIIVGAGPAGLFAALRLIERNIKPIILERGKDVDSRRLDMAAIARRAEVNPDSNYCFGEGGAGAYSDGKLFTRSKKRGSVDHILEILHMHGAKAEILSDAHPHIGTDRLPEIIKAIRKTIIRCGGEVHFSTKVTDLIIDGGNATGAITADGKTFLGPVILATGHSARDVYKMLVANSISLQPKGIAVGVRLEHPQALIDRIRYHNPQGRGKFLPPAEYTMLTRVDNRAVYSFCMCPGGVIIPAASSPGEMVVNGMSSSSRGGRWANSGMVVEILPEDIPDRPDGDPLKMMYFQQQIEQTFFADRGDGTQNAPAQRMTDFVAGRPSSSLPPTSYAPGIHPARIDLLLPPSIARRLQKGFEEFGRKNRGFLTDQAILIGDETRTSAPVRIPRDAESLQHIDIAGLYPCGEGAGYAGGIVSAAVDGERCAEAASTYIKQTAR